MTSSCITTKNNTETYHNNLSYAIILMSIFVFFIAFFVAFIYAFGLLK